jgi:hypothetical protein
LLALNTKGSESTVAKLFTRIQSTRTFVVGLTVVAALVCGGFFDGPH